jgi:hypothetical protein
MWITKGVLLGLAVFIVGGFLYLVIRMSIGFYQAAQAAKSGVPQPLTATDIRAVIQNPILWIALFAAIAVGLWIVRSRMHVGP